MAVTWCLQEGIEHRVLSSEYHYGMKNYLQSFEYAKMSFKMYFQNLSLFKRKKRCNFSSAKLFSIFEKFERFRTVLHSFSSCNSKNSKNQGGGQMGQNCIFCCYRQYLFQALFEVFCEKIRTSRGFWIKTFFIKPSTFWCT